MIAITSLMSRTTGSTAGRSYRAAQQTFPPDHDEYEIEGYAVLAADIPDDQLIGFIDRLHNALADIEAPPISITTFQNLYFVGSRGGDQYYSLELLPPAIEITSTEDNNAEAPIA